MLCFVSSHAVVICHLHDVLRIVCATPGSIEALSTTDAAWRMLRLSDIKVPKSLLSFPSHFISYGLQTARAMHISAL